MTKQRIQDVVLIKEIKEIKEMGEGHRRFNKAKFLFYAFVLFLTIILMAKVIDAFSGVTVQVVLHEEKISVDAILKAAIAGSADLPFETMEISLTNSKSAPSTGMEKIEKKASGQIFIFNAYSSQSQTLIKNTRFEAPDGKIYRIDRQIVVPGAKVVSGNIVPSSIEATVYADQPGEEYNVDLTDFTIPGFRGGPRYEKFYARSKTVMSGGFKGEVPVVSNDDLKNLTQSLETSLKNELLDKANAQKPEGFLYYDNASKIVFSENKQTAGSATGNDNLVFTLSETGDFFAYIFPQKDFSDALVRKYLGEDFVGKVEARDLEKLNFELISQDKDRGVVIFSLKGEVRFVWVVDGEKLKESLVASSKDLESVFSQYPAIEHAAVVFRPSWWHFFPDEISRIKIEPVD